MTALLALALVHCGARSELRSGVASDVVRTGVDASRDVADSTAPPDVTPDTTAPDAPPECPDLTLTVGPVTAFTASNGTFATPRIVSRLGGFDVLAPGPEMGIRGRRMMVSGSPATITFGDPATIGENSWTWAEAGTDGANLALCYSASGPTFRLWAGTYVSSAQRQLGFSTPVGISAGVAWAGDRWISGWSNYSTSTSWIVELSPAGRPLAPARMAGINLSNTPPSLVAYGHGAAWAASDAPGHSIVVVFSSQGRPDIRQSFAVSGTPHSLRLAAWPPDPSAVAIAWRDETTAVHLLVAHEDGSHSEDRAAILGEGGTPRDIEIAPFRDGVVVADVACGDFNPQAGRIAVHRFGADGNERGRGAIVPLDCSGSLSLASIAASEQEIALAWLSPRGDRLDDDVQAAVFRCLQ